MVWSSPSSISTLLNPSVVGRSTNTSSMSTISERVRSFNRVVILSPRYRGDTAKPFSLSELLTINDMS